LRILFVNQFYWPDHAATAQVLADLAEHAARAGHSVAVVASRARYAAPGAPRLPAEDARGGVRIHRVRASGLGRRSLVHRAADYASFFALAAARMARLPDVDAIVTLTTPPLLGALGALWQALRGIPHVAWIMDVYPELAVRFGALRADGAAARVAEAAARRVLTRAAGVIVLGDDMAAAARAHGARAERITVARNWADGEAVRPMAPAASAFRRGLALPEPCVVFGYFGNFGRGHRFEAILEVARRRGADPRVRFVFGGDGPRLREVREFCARRGLANAHFAPSCPRDALGDVLAAATIP
jgi:hypothetical protein